MQVPKKKIGSNEESKKKERHIVTWTQQVLSLLFYQSRFFIYSEWDLFMEKLKFATSCEFLGGLSYLGSCEFAGR